MLTVCYINRQPGRGYHYSDTNSCGESAASKNVIRCIFCNMIKYHLDGAQSNVNCETVIKYNAIFFSKYFECFLKFTMH